MPRRSRASPPPPTPVRASRPRLSRRDFGRAIATGLAAAALGACGRSAGAEGGAARLACTLYPQQTEGPFYVDADLLRRDIREGRSGAPLRLELRVVSAGACAPLHGLLVDVWHCDAGGLYSGYRGQLGDAVTTGETFLRGSQVTDDDGRAVFETIYPGWYPGRTTHVHFKVHVGPRKEATSQIYFPDDVTAAVYRAPPYAARGAKDTTNLSDGVVRHDGAPPLARVAREGSNLVATLLVGVAT